MAVMKRFCFSVALFCSIISVHCQLTMVQRNQIDSFRVADGCESHPILCSKYEAYCLENKCICQSSSPHFRNPIISQEKGYYSYGKSYGCITNEIMKEQRLDKAACSFIPRIFFLLPHEPTNIPTSINYNGRHNYLFCRLSHAEVKYPDSNDWFNLPWLNESMIHFSPQKRDFQWTASVADLQGCIIIIFLNCYNDFTTTQECLQAKIEGKWSKAYTTLPPTNTLTETQTTSPQVPTEISHPNPSTKPLLNITTGRNNDSSNTWRNVSLALLVVFPVIIVILIAFHIVRMKRKLREPETVDPSSNAVYEYPDASFHGSTNQRDKNQTTEKHTYLEPTDVNTMQLNADTENELSHYQSLQRDDAEELNTYEHLTART